MDDHNNYLEHYGVKGMRWGVRKRSKKEEKERAKRFKKSQNRRTLSDDELNKQIDRLSREKKLKQLTDEDLRPGRTIAKKIVSESGQRVAATVVTGAGLYATKVALDRKFDMKEAAGYMAPKPKKK